MPLALPCPYCRTVPAWMGGHRATELRGVRSAFLIGCRHTHEVFGMKIIEAPAGNAALEKWNAEAERLFVTYTARWTDAERSHFRAVLGYPAEAPAAASQPSTLSSPPSAS